MKQETFNLSVSDYIGYRAALSAHLRNPCPWPMSEAIVKTYKALDGVVQQAQVAIGDIEVPGEDATEAEQAAYDTAKQAILDTHAKVTAYRISKKQQPQKWSPQKLSDLYFMFYDWSEIYE